jgi:hypothetical protein
MKPAKGPRRILGLRLPYLMETVVDVGEKAGKLIADVIADPRRASEAQVQRIRKVLDEDRCRASDAAVEAGRGLLWLRLNPGDEGFATHVKRLGMSPRTARNKMALALFAAAYPALYGKLRILGPSKLYRLAVLNPRSIQHISVDDPVETPRGQVPLRQLTSREFEAWMRAQMPPPKRESWIRRAQRHLQKSASVMERNAGQPVDAAEEERFKGTLAYFNTWLAGTIRTLPDEDGR